MVEWEPKAAALVRTLTESGELRSAHWQRAFAEVPRHLFVPGYWEFNSDRAYVDASDPDRWLDGVYANEVLITQTKRPRGVGWDEETQIPTSSSSMPGVMAYMLELLGVEDGQRVLEIGTGTGYNAALLCHRLGDTCVASIDLDPQLVETAAEHLAEAGYRPTLHAGDGAAGLPDDGPFDRILATAAIDHVPSAWIEQLAPSGIIVAPLQGNISGELVKLTNIRDDTVEGHFDAYPVSFMPLRPTLENPHRHESAEAVIDRSNPYRTTTTIDPKFVSDDADFRFFLQAYCGAMFSSSITADESGELFVIEPDGSWFVVQGRDDGEVRVISQSGPRRLWDTVETAHELWQRLGRPGRNRFGVTATDDEDGQRVWLDKSTGSYGWPLPL